MLDVKTSVPNYIHNTNASVHDVNILDHLSMSLVDIISLFEVISILEDFAESIVMMFTLLPGQNQIPNLNELSFKWLKQNLMIKSYWGTSPNEVKTKIYSAIIIYCQVADIGYKLKVDRLTYEIIEILSISLLEKTPIKELLTSHNYKDVKELNYI
jgi:hypothetical protein